MIKRKRGDLTMNNLHISPERVELKEVNGNLEISIKTINLDITDVDNLKLKLIFADETFVSDGTRYFCVNCNHELHQAFMADYVETGEVTACPFCNHEWDDDEITTILDEEYKAIQAEMKKPLNIFADEVPAVSRLIEKASKLEKEIGWGTDKSNKKIGWYKNGKPRIG